MNQIRPFLPPPPSTPNLTRPRDQQKCQKKRRHWLTASQWYGARLSYQGSAFNDQGQFSKQHERSTPRRRAPSRTFARVRHTGRHRSSYRGFGASAVRLQEQFMADLKRASPSPPLISGRNCVPLEYTEEPDPLSPSLTLQDQDFDVSPDRICISLS